MSLVRVQAWILSSEERDLQCGIGELLAAEEIKFLELRKTSEEGRKTLFIKPLAEREVEDSHVGPPRMQGGRDVNEGEVFFSELLR